MQRAAPGDSAAAPRITFRPTTGLMSRRLSCLISGAFKAAVAKAIDENARLGLPVYLGRDGTVIELSSDELRDLSRLTQGQ
jgi:hypothetical protein